MSDKTTRKTPSKPNLKSKRAITWAVIVIASVALLFGVYEVGRYNNKWGEPDTLRAIKTEKLASKDLLELKLISSSQQGEGSFVSKILTSSVTREFEPGGDGIDATVSKIVEFAEADGWVYDPSVYPSRPERRVWRKLKDRDIRMVLYVEQGPTNIIIEVSAYDY